MVKKSCISRLEQCESVQVDNLFKILLALRLGDNTELLVPDQTKSPSLYLEKTDNKQLGQAPGYPGLAHSSIDL